MAVVTDLALSRRLERAEARAGAAFVERRARAVPGRGAAWIDVAGAYAMFDGVGSPVTQTFGLGLFAPASADDLAALEAFFAERGADVNHEVSPLADAALLALLPERGYRPVELTSVMHQPLGDDVSGDDAREGALLRARLRHAAALGCDTAMMGAAPGSASQRNAERAGFRIAYTRIKWGRPHGAHR